MDDHTTFAELLARALGGEPDLKCVGHAQSAVEARALAVRLRPDLVLTDVQLGSACEDGIALADSLARLHPATVVVVLSAFADADLIRRASEAGVCGVVPKDGSLSGLLDVLRRAERGALIVHPSLVSSLLPSARRPVEPVVLLTPREQEVLTLLADGLDATTIARRLGVSTHTCRGYVKCVLAKLGAHTQLEAVVRAARRGLVHVDRV